MKTRPTQLALLEKIEQRFHMETQKSHHHKEDDLPAGLAQPARRALTGAGIQRLEQLTKYSEAEIKQLHGIGPNAVNQLRNALYDKGLSFASGE